MMIIKQLSKDIECNICEAEDKIETAYALKSRHPNEALWYKEMAAAHLGFNTKAHDYVKDHIAAYKASDEYKKHPEYADGMLAVWNDRHAELSSTAARIKAMIDTYK